MSFICKHCGGEFDESAKILDESQNAFCCNGCKNVYAFLSSAGFDEFYTRLGSKKANRPSPKTFSANSAATLFSQLLSRDKEKPFICEIVVQIEGIHCSACVWLNQKALSNLQGVLEVEVSGATNRARVLYDERQIALKDVLNMIVAIGYEPKPFAVLGQNSENSVNATNKASSRSLYAKLIVGIACSMNIMWIGVALYSGYFSGMDAGLKKLLHFGEFVLASPAVFYTGSAFFAPAWSAVKNRQISMDVNVSIGILAVYFYSVYVMLSAKGEVYFDSACMLSTFIFIGKFLQDKAKQRAALGVESISTLFASVVNASKDGAEFSQKEVRNVESGEYIMLREGERAMIDGVVVSGSASVDNSSINGESLPLALSQGSSVTSGALCVSGSLIYKASASFEGSFLSKLARMLGLAEFKKPRIEEKVNQIASKFSAVVLALFALSFAFWFFSSQDFSKALAVAISVVVIACPCALSLATPLASITALSTALRLGVIFKEARIIETLSKCKIVAFDKTGTLSSGSLAIKKSFGAYSLNENEQSLLYSLLALSAHPVSKALSKELSSKLWNSKILEFQSFESVAGKGIKASFGGLNLLGGSKSFLQENKVEFQNILEFQNDLEFQNGEFSEYYFAISNKVRAGFFLADELRAEAKEVVTELKKLGLKVCMLSGDKSVVASKVASELEIDEFWGELNPLEKAQKIKELQKIAPVAMIGDGINDIAALQSANVGIAMGQGASVSINTSDVVLLKDDLLGLKNAFLLSKRTYRVIKENLGLSLVYNLCSIPLAMLGFVIPLFAAISMSASSLLVVLNSLKLRKI